MGEALVGSGKYGTLLVGCLKEDETVMGSRARVNASADKCPFYHFSLVLVLAHSLTIIPCLLHIERPVAVPKKGGALFATFMITLRFHLLIYSILLGLMLLLGMMPGCVHAATAAAIWLGAS